MTLLVMPQLGMTQLCLPAPPVTKILIFSGFSVIGIVSESLSACCHGAHARSSKLSSFAYVNYGFVKYIGRDIGPAPTIRSAGPTCSGQRAMKYSQLMAHYFGPMTSLLTQLYQGCVRVLRIPYRERCVGPTIIVVTADSASMPSLLAYHPMGKSQGFQRRNTSTLLDFLGKASQS